MNSMTTELSADNIAVILKACSESGVMELNFHDLRVIFGRTAKTKEAQPELIQAPAAVIAEPAPLADEIEARAEQLMQMFIEDPAQAEKLLLDGELEDDDGDDL